MREHGHSKKIHGEISFLIGIREGSHIPYTIRYVDLQDATICGGRTKFLDSKDTSTSGAPGEQREGKSQVSQLRAENEIFVQ